MKIRFLLNLEYRYQELLENQMHLGIHSEIWEDRKKAAHANTIEEALEMYGIQYISTPRPNSRSYPY